MFGDQGNLMNMLLWFAVFFGIIYFIIIRPNNKQQKERRSMLDSIRVRDKVVTIGGMHGTITKINEDTVMLKIAANVEIELTRAAVQSIENRDYKEESAKGKKLKRGKEEKQDEVDDNAPSENDEVDTDKRY